MIPRLKHIYHLWWRHLHEENWGESNCALLRGSPLVKPPFPSEKKQNRTAPSSQLLCCAIAWCIRSTQEWYGNESPQLVESLARKVSTSNSILAIWKHKVGYNRDKDPHWIVFFLVLSNPWCGVRYIISNIMIFTTTWKKLSTGVPWQETRI